MKSSVSGVLAAAVLALPLQAQSPAMARPNVIVLVADDLGWRDTGVYGNRFIRTPNIDWLARSGLTVRFAFGTSPQCSPSRISMLTGKYAHATRTEDLHTPLPDGERILPSYLKDLGYFTGNMLKTHYGPNGERQFEWYAARTADSFPAFLDAAGTRPFFLWAGFHEHRPFEKGAVTPPHPQARVALTPHLADTPETRADLALYYDANSRMDSEIGRMLEELDRRKLREKTIVLFLSDDGAPFAREKGTLYDGGTRSPLIISWPSVIRPGSVFDRGLVSLVDVAPTIIELAGGRPPASMQGQSFRGLLNDPETYAGRTYVFIERNWHDCDVHQRAVRSRRFKLIRTDAYTELPLCVTADIAASPSFRSLRARADAHRLTAAQQRLFESPRARLELYDLERDPWELRNVAADPRYGKPVAELAAVLQEWIERSDDFPAAYRVRDDNTDRITGIPFNTRIPPLRNAGLPTADQRWGKRQAELGM
jgi:N-sulfoglucosamine sulfohydrolase